MRIPGLKTAKHSIKWLRNRIFPGAIILGYHRIDAVDNDSFDICVSPENFAQQMQVLSRYTQPIHLDELVGHVVRGNRMSRTVCVTIDDGYADVLYNAKPVLEKHNIPATVFVTTGNLGSEFWWDEVERCILILFERAGRLHLRVGSQSLDWDFSDTNREAIKEKIVALVNLLRPLDDNSRRQYLDELNRLADSGSGGELIRARSMTPDELVALVDTGLIRIGSHSVTHPSLPDLSIQERQNELRNSKRVLEQIISKPVKGFSYPNGHFTSSDSEMVQRFGYHYACASMIGTVRQASNPFTLPRFWPQDISGEKFERWLRLWLA